MSAEAADRTGATQKRNTPTPYWAFFPKDEGAFWHFLDRHRVDGETSHRRTHTSSGAEESRLRRRYKAHVRREHLLSASPPMTRTRTVFYVVHRTPEQPYPLHSGPAFRSLERARLEAHKLAQQGYGGWIMRLREVRQEHGPDDHWRIDHSMDEAILWLEQF
jgi:hypothetical protein